MDVNFSGSGMPESFSCTRPSTFSSDSISNTSAWKLDTSIGEGTIVAALILGGICVVAFVWNLFILVMYCYQYHLLKHPANIFLFALALNDFLVSVTILPGSVVTYIANEFIIGSTDAVRCGFCYFQGFLMIFCPVVSINVLAILSIDRCFLLSNPLIYKDKENPVVAIIIMIVVWIFSFFLCIPPALGFGEWEFNTSIAVCMARFTPNYNLWFMFLIIMYSLIPIITLAITNVWTYKIVSKFLKRRRKRKLSYRGSFKERREDNTQHQQQQTQLVRVFGALFIANIVIWSPLIVMVFVVFAVGDSIPGWIYIIFWIMVASNSMVHPILESFFIKELRVTVDKGKRKVSKTVRTTSRSLIRMATRDSIRKMSFLSHNESQSSIKENGLNDSVFLNDTEGTLEADDKMSTPKQPAFERVRRTGAPSSPVTKRHTFHSYNPSGDTARETSHKDHKVSSSDQSSCSLVSPNTFSHSPSPLLSGESSKPSTPSSSGKTRHVSISLPDDTNIYYPHKTQSPTHIHQPTVFEEDDDVMDNDDVMDDGDDQTASVNSKNSSTDREEDPHKQTANDYINAHSDIICDESESDELSNGIGGSLV